MVGEVVGLVEGEMGSLEVRFLQENAFLTENFSGGRREAADRTAFHKQFATHAP